MKIQAITICINYSDYLECVIENASFFDRWTVMTVEADQATQDLCRRKGVECHVSHILQANGADFNAAWNKAGVINEALERVEADGWVIVIDSDVLLPRHFRRRLEALKLEEGCLYGLEGRRICQNRRSFEVLRQAEPWTSALDRNTQPLGYFQLFHARSLPNRYPVKEFDRLRPHDDTLFTICFPQASRRLLPFTALHVGTVQSNWNQRTTATYDQAQCRNNLFSGKSLAFHVEPYLRKGGAGAILGYFPDGLWRDFAGYLDRFYLIDHHQVHQRSLDENKEADRHVLREMLETEAAGLDNLVWLGAFTRDTLARIPDGSLDLLCVAGGCSHESLFAAFPLWRRKLKEGAMVCGDLFLHAEWYEGVISISSLLGIPDQVTPQGYWWKRFSPVQAVAAVANQRPELWSQDNGVVIVASQADDLEPTYLSIHSVRAHWSGPIMLIYTGEENEALVAACNQLCCELKYFGELSIGVQLDGSDLATATALQRFTQAIVLRAGMLAVAGLDSFFTRSAFDEPWSHRGPLIAQRVNGEMRCFRLPFSDCQESSGPVSIMAFEGSSEHWSESAWETWSDRKTAMIEESALEIRLRGDTTIVVIVDEESYGDLQHNWLYWKFPAHSPVILLLIDLSVDDIWLPGNRPPTQILSMSVPEGALPATILRRIKDACFTESILFLPSTVTPFPGAELWADLQWGTYSVVRHVPAAVLDEISITGNVFVPEPCWALVKSDYIGVLEERAACLDGVHSLAVLMHFAAMMEPDAFGAVDAGNWGWRIPPTHAYVPRRLLERNAAGWQQFGE